MFGFSFINIQQFNQGLSSVERSKFKGVDLSPQQSDFKDSTNPYQDADVVLGTMCPYKLDMNTCLGYDIKKLKDKMIMLKVIKNRLSRDNVAIGLYANPSAGAYDSRSLFAFTVNENWEYHTQTSAIELPIVYEPLDTPNNDNIINQTSLAFQTNSDNRLFTDSDRILRYERARFYNNIVM